MEKRFILALILSAIVIFAFQNYIQKTQKVPVQTIRPSSVDTPQQIARNEDAKIPEQELKEEEILTEVETEKYLITFTNIGGSIKNIKLKEYKDTHTGEPLTLIENTDPLKAISSMQLQNPPAVLGKAIFDLTVEKNKIIYTYVLPDRYEIKKEFNFYNSSDYIELGIFIKNITPFPLGLQYQIAGPSGLEATDKLMGRNFLELDSMVDGKIIRRTKVRAGEEMLSGSVSWVGMKNRYFSIVMRPKEATEAVILKEDRDKKISTSLRTEVRVVSRESILHDSFVLYIGPIDIKRMAVPNLGIESVVNYGVFGGITILLLKILRFFEGLVRNWGVAIILLTLLVNIILFPLTRKSFVSMRKMQEMQPHIEKLRSLHKDNPHKLNKELAELYRANNVNPFGGCLPLLLQMPIFVALYQGLMKSIELKNAKFLWIKDLSNPDSISLPFTLPILGDHINILPILMIIAMFFQQKISAHGTAGVSEEQRKQQQIMLFIFPIFFGILFYNFPSGLVLYWFTNTILMVIEHSALRKVL